MAKSKRGNPKIQDLAESNRVAADEHAVKVYREHVAALVEKDLSHARIASALNVLDVRTARDGKWHKTTVARLIARAEQLGASGSDAARRIRLVDRQVVVLAMAAERYLEMHPRHRGESLGERRLKARLQGLDLPQPRFVGDDMIELERTLEDWLVLGQAAGEVLTEIEACRDDIADRPQACTRKHHFDRLLMVQIDALRAAVARLPRR